MDEEVQKIKEAIVRKYADMTLDQIADDVILIVESAARKGIDAGYELAKKKLMDGIIDWERQEKLKAIFND